MDVKARLITLGVSLIMELAFVSLMVLVIRYGLGLSTIADDLEGINGVLTRIDDSDATLDSGRGTRSVHVVIPDYPEGAH